MRLQHSNIVDEPAQAPVKKAPAKEYGVVTVSMGSGIAELFKSIGADEVIEGGQTMNPSTEDIVKAVNKVNAKTVFVLPNNKNIIMAAEQAAQVSDIEVIVIPSKTVPQGMSALLALNTVVAKDKNEAAMKNALGQVKTGQITFAVRDTNIDGIEIEKDDFMGINEGKITVTNKDKVEAAKGLLSSMMDEDSEILTIFKGEDATNEDLEAIESFVEENYPDVEIEIHDGKQPLYAFIFSIE